MRFTLKILVGLALGWAIAMSGSAPAQLIKKLSDLDPTNKNSGIRQAGRDADKGRLDIMSPDPRPGRDYTKVYIKNDTAKTLWVAVYYQPYPFPKKGGESELKGGDPEAKDTDPYDLHSWLKFKPGEKALVAKTHNPEFFYYAKDAQGNVWDGKSIYRHVDGKKIGLSLEMILTPQQEEHTISLRGNGKLVATIDMGPPPAAGKPVGGKPKLELASGTPIQNKPITGPKKDLGAGQPKLTLTGEADPNRANPGTPAGTISVRFTNRTDRTIRFMLNGGKGLEAQLKAGEARGFNMAVNKGTPPAIQIAQPDGIAAPLKFSVENQGRYAFRYQGKAVINTFDP